MSCTCGGRGHFGLGGGRDEERCRKLVAMEAEKKRKRSVGAKKRVALRWCNRDESSPLSLRAYAPGWFRRPRLDYAAGEGSSRGSSSASSPPAFPNSWLIYARNDAEEHAYLAAAIRASEDALAEELRRERAEAAMALAAVRARERQEAAELAAAVAKADEDAMDVDVVFLDD